MSGSIISSRLAWPGQQAWSEAPVSSEYIYVFQTSSPGWSRSSNSVREGVLILDMADCVEHCSICVP